LDTPLEKAKGVFVLLEQLTNTESYRNDCICKTEHQNSDL